VPKTKSRVGPREGSETATIFRADFWSQKKRTCRRALVRSFVPKYGSVFRAAEPHSMLILYTSSASASNGMCVLRYQECKTPIAVKGSNPCKPTPRVRNTYISQVIRSMEADIKNAKHIYPSRDPIHGSRYQECKTLITVR
jgi:hypothetical protein